MKLAIVLLSIVLVASNAYWAYRSLDQGVGFHYALMELEQQRKRMDSLATLLSAYVRGTPLEQLQDTIAIELPDAAPFVKEGALHVPFISFVLDEDTVVAVE